jgi:hypothetical protein
MECLYPSWAPCCGLTTRRRRIGGTAAQRNTETMHIPGLPSAHFKGRWTRPKLSVSAYKFAAQLFFEQTGV